MSGLGKSTIFVGGSGDARIDGLLYDRAWGDGTLTYSAPTTQLDYGTGYGASEHLGLQSPTAALIAAQRRYLDADYGNTANDGFSLEGFADLSLVQTTQANAHIRIALTDRDPYNFGTAWGYFPATAAAAGDVWLSDVRYDYSSPQTGNYANATVIHELGHAIGLEHAHDFTAYGAVPGAFDSMEYTVMTYRSYVGASTNQYTNEAWGYAQSFMMLDIAALQHIYGANFTTNSGDTVYSWTPGSGDTMVDGVVGLSPGANRIFATIWDGGGEDTFDLSAYTTALSIDLGPGQASTFDAAQLARLGSGVDASGNIYNALLYQDDTRSLIENVIGGSGKDRITGNAANNLLEGRKGSDRLTGLNGDDQLIGKVGRDVLAGGNGADILKGGRSNDILKGGTGKDRLFGQDDDDRLKGGKGADVLFGGAGADVFLFTAIEQSPADSGRDVVRDFESGLDRIDISALSVSAFSFVGSDAFSGTDPSVRYEQVGGSTRVLADAVGDGIADLGIDLRGNYTLSATDFIL
jgi:serralysin